ncbi:MAG: hypothetical protein ABL962_13725, partial [Fimbriimonadaceae bacterium]
CAGHSPMVRTKTWRQEHPWERNWLVRRNGPRVSVTRPTHRACGSTALGYDTRKSLTGEGERGPKHA